MFTRRFGRTDFFLEESLKTTVLRAISALRRFSPPVGRSAVPGVCLRGVAEMSLRDVNKRSAEAAATAAHTAMAAVVFAAWRTGARLRCITEDTANGMNLKDIVLAVVSYMA